jgi:hypothetical protein
LPIDPIGATRCERIGTHNIVRQTKRVPGIRDIFAELGGEQELTASSMEELMERPTGALYFQLASSFSIFVKSQVGNFASK